MHRVLPLCAVFCASVLVFAGFGAGAVAPTPEPPAPESTGVTDKATGAEVVPSSKWAELNKLPTKRS